tara:strand:+ start:827 stop:1207 length:381 start_codon:yes stop_codon:yes gene_type:complete
MNMKTQWIYDKIPENGELIMLLPVINWERQMKPLEPATRKKHGPRPEQRIKRYVIVVDYGDDASSFDRRFFVACAHKESAKRSHVCFDDMMEGNEYWYNSQYDLTRREAINMANRMAFGKYSKVII